MSRFVSQVNVGENTNVTYKITGAVTDADVNKPVKLSATDLVVLCSDGDPIYGFINSVERATADGKVVVGVQIGGRRKVTLSGSVAIGAIVEAAANTSVGVALGQNWGIVSTKTAVASNVPVNNATSLDTSLATDANGTAIATAVNNNAAAINTLSAALDTAGGATNAILADAVNGGLVKNWVLISGAGTTGTDGLVELQ